MRLTRGPGRPAPHQPPCGGSPPANPTYPGNRPLPGSTGRGRSRMSAGRRAVANRFPVPSKTSSPGRGPARWHRPRVALRSSTVSSGGGDVLRDHARFPGSPHPLPPAHPPPGNPAPQREGEQGSRLRTTAGISPPRSIRTIRYSDDSACQPRRKGPQAQEHTGSKGGRS